MCWCSNGSKFVVGSSNCISQAFLLQLFTIMTIMPAQIIDIKIDGIVTELFYALIEGPCCYIVFCASIYLQSNDIFRQLFLCVRDSSRVNEN